MLAYLILGLSVGNSAAAQVVQEAPTQESAPTTQPSDNALLIDSPSAELVDTNSQVADQPLTIQQAIDLAVQLYDQLKETEAGQNAQIGIVKNFQHFDPMHKNDLLDWAIARMVDASSWNVFAADMNSAGFVSASTSGMGNMTIVATSPTATMMPVTVIRLTMRRPISMMSRLHPIIPRAQAV